MPLLGPAAMLLLFDVAPDAIADHDDWHSTEHLPERLAIPGFLRGTRWIATHGGPRYMVVYEVDDLATLSSPAYLERLNAPSAWTSRLMPHYRGMRRTFCTVAASAGSATAPVARLMPLARVPDASWRARFIERTTPHWLAEPGIAGAHLLVGAATPPMTREQRIRGTADGGIAAALLVTGHDAPALQAIGLDPASRRDVDEPAEAMYRLDDSRAR